MYLKTEVEINHHEWTSKTGKKFMKPVKLRVHHFVCDKCKKEFTREASKVSQSRLNNNFSHFCQICFDYGYVAKMGIDKQVQNLEKKVGGKYVDACGYTRVYVGPKTGRKLKSVNKECYGSVREHILIMENHLGRALEKGEVVHHIDGNKQNNQIENLDLCSVKEHNNCHAKIEQIVFDLYAKGLVGYDRANKMYYLKDSV